MSNTENTQPTVKRFMVGKDPRILIYIEKSLHRKLKIIAAKEDLSISQVLDDIVRLNVDNYKNPRVNIS